eukprot:SAG31_NODE_18589_length_630_cov_1.139360_1_plen_68_part_10
MQTPDCFRSRSDRLEGSTAEKPVDPMLAAAPSGITAVRCRCQARLDGGVAGDSAHSLQSSAAAAAAGL